jgi:hypothetical protein
LFTHLRFTSPPNFLSLKVGTLLGPPANGTRKAEPRQEAGPFENLGLFRKRRKDDYRAMPTHGALGFCKLRGGCFRVAIRSKQPSYEILIK